MAVILSRIYGGGRSGGRVQKLSLERETGYWIFFIASLGKQDENDIKVCVINIFVQILGTNFKRCKRKIVKLARLVI